jgi:hypothetical protein
LEPPSLIQLEDGEKELNIEAHWNTFKVGIGKGIKMLKLGPMNNNLDLRFGDYGNHDQIFYYRWKKQKIESSLKFKRSPKYCNLTWG